MRRIRDLGQKNLQKEITLTEKLEKKTETEKSRNAVRVSVKSVRRGARCLWGVGFEK